MFNYDKSGIEKFSSKFNPIEIATIAKFLKFSKDDKNSSLSKKEFKKGLDFLKKVTKLKLNKSYFAFHVNDDWAESQTNMGSGINLYRRHDSILECEMGHSFGDEVPQEEDIYKYLINNKIAQIYTGSIPLEGFLGIKYESIDDKEYSTTHDELEESEIEYFTSNGIKVITLEQLL